jgi:hypothetical protein
MSKDVADRKELWLSVSVRGPQDSDFTLLNPRHNLDAPNAVNALTCPHTHFTDYWGGSTTGYYGLEVDNGGTGDGLRAYSASTTNGYAALWAVNTASTGYGTAVYGSSATGLGVYAYSGAGDALEATTNSTTKSAIYAHATDSNGVWALSTNKQGVHGGSTNDIGVHGDSASNYGVEGLSTNNYGGFFKATNMAGARLQTDLPASYYGAVVDGGLHVVNGNCVGCALVYSGENGGTEDIRAGDLVAAAGVKVDPATQQPILLVRRATSADDAVIGVAIGAAASPSDVDRSGPATVGKSGVGIIATGEYVQVMISGLAQVKVSGKVAMGSRLAPSGEGAVPAANAINSVARVMSEPDENGLVWVLVDAR